MRKIIYSALISLAITSCGNLTSEKDVKTKDQKNVDVKKQKDFPIIGVYSIVDLDGSYNIIKLDSGGVFYTYSNIKNTENSKGKWKGSADSLILYYENWTSKAIITENGLEYYSDQFFTFFTRH